METQTNGHGQEHIYVHGYTNANSASGDNSDNSSSRKRHTLLARDGNIYTPIRIKQIAVFSSSKKSVVAIDFNGARYHIDESLTDVENILEVPFFFRVNRNIILHVEAIRTFRVVEFGKIVVDLVNPEWLEEDVHISQYRAPRFRDWISGL